ncbi:MAG: PAS domain S-box protein [Pirellulaceae bacterium]|nr:PAS domain S-box protein [Pirellulaceae bacterium]
MSTYASQVRVQSRLLADIRKLLLQETDPRQAVAKFCRVIMDELALDLFIAQFTCGPLTGFKVCYGATAVEQAEADCRITDKVVCTLASDDTERSIALDETPRSCTSLECLRELGIAAYACHVMESDGERLGCLCFGSKQRAAFDENELQTMQAVADLVAVSMRLLNDRMELYNRDERMRAILESAVDAIITINHQGVITDVSSATTGMFGYSADELIGQNVKILMPSPHREQHDSYLNRFQETGIPHIINAGRELLAQRKDGTTFPIELVVSQVDHLQLYTGIIRDISERKALQKQVLEIVTEEQQRIGHELHDGTGQELTGLSLIVGTLTEHLKRAQRTVIDGGDAWLLKESDYLRVKQLAERVAKGLGEAHQHVHDLSHGIMPIQIEVEGLAAAITKLAQSTHGQSGISCISEIAGCTEAISQTCATNLYRIAQESISNAVRHGQATEIRVILNDEVDRIVLEVVDNGIGFEPSIVHSGSGDGMGLRIMAYRANMIGGSLEILPREPGGMCVRCIVPTAAQQQN